MENKSVSPNSKGFFDKLKEKFGNGL